jgi:hypothetical protein
MTLLTLPAIGISAFSTKLSSVSPGTLSAIAAEVPPAPSR